MKATLLDVRDAARREPTVGVLCLTLALCACAVAPPPGPAPEARPSEEYRIGPGDVLEIAVWKDEGLSRTLPVRPDGMISLPLLQDVQAAGLTPDELRRQLAERLAQFMPAPELSVIVREVHSFAVTVLGEVKRPGRYELRSRVSVLDALAAAGGLTEFASTSDIHGIRAAPGERRRIHFNYDSAVGRSGSQENFLVQPGDTIVVR